MFVIDIRTSQIDGEEFVFIVAPFFYPDGDHMQVYLSPPKDGSTLWTIGDAGETVAKGKFERGLGDDLNFEQGIRLGETLRMYRSWTTSLDYTEGELKMTVEEDRLPWAIWMFLQVQIRLSAICAFDNYGPQRK